MEQDKEDKRTTSLDLDDSDTNDSNSENSTTQSDNGSSSTGYKKKKISKALKELTINNNMKFMNNFDPELSNRERRKLNRKFTCERKKSSSMYNEFGVLCGSDKDICDCLIDNCPGCHFPCPKCRSYKCGLDCRVNRKWMYEAIEYEDASLLINNSRTSSNCSEFISPSINQTKQSLKDSSIHL